MALFDELKMYGRFAWGLRRFLREGVSMEDARKTVQRLLAEREANFLRLAERAIFGYPRSPYLPMLKMAGCELGDLRNMVGQKGLEGALRVLREAGVYVTYEEFKGRKPIVRGGKELPVRPHEFDNPLPLAAFTVESGGSTGAGTRSSHDLDHLRVISAHELITYAAHGVTDMPKVIWRGVLPDGSGIDNVLRLSHWGRVPDKWFSHRNPYDLRPIVFKYRMATMAALVIGRLSGVPLPWPKYVKLEDASIVARWIAAALKEHGKCLVLAPASRSLRICLAARDEGLNFTGAVFRTAGEPVTKAKVNAIRATGAKVFTTYGYSEIGRIGMGCSRPIDANDLHLCKSMCAMFPYDRLVPGTEIKVPAFNFSSILPTAPKILLNAESDDYGIVEERSCGCPLEELGLTEHLREIYSFQKLTSEGMSLVGSEMVRILEEVLPERFGGSPVDYQLLEEEDQDGITRLSLLIHPRVNISSEREVIDVMLAALRKSSVSADAARSTWDQGNTFRVRREAPIWTGRGKLMSLYVAKRYQNVSLS
jgi:hypothetical protein